MDPQAWSQATGRIGSLEDLLRRNEGSLGSALGRVKDIETALNTMHRALGRIGPDLSATIDEMKAAKRRLDIVDASAQSKIRDVEGALQQEIRANKPIPLGSDPVFTRLASEHASTSGDLQETISQVRRLTDAVSADGKALRAVESDTRWLGEQVRDQVAAHRDLSNTTTRRLEQVSLDVHSTQEEIRTVDAGLRKIIDAAVQASREELLLRLEQETKARVALQADFVAAFGRMREDVIKGFSETATNLKNLDETSHSLETVLRAEVRSRMAAQEEYSKRVDGVEERLRREALSAAEYLKALDTQMSAALRDVRDVSASECRSQLDTVWRSVDDLTDQVKKINGKQTAENATNEEIAATRNKMLIDAAVQDSREEMLRLVNSRIQSATAEIDACASKSEVHELRTRLELKLQEAERKSEGRQSMVKFDAAAGGPEHQSSTSTAMRLKKVTERVDDAEKQLLVVAEAVRDVHEELVDKLERVETQSAALDALQKSLQGTFERDQAAMQEQTEALRTELIGVMEEIEKIRPPVDADAKPAAATPTPADDGADPVAADATPDNRPSDASPSPNSPSSPSIRFAHRALEQQLRTVRQDLATLQHDTRRDAAELKSQQEQLYDRHVAMAKTHRDDNAALKADMTAVSDRAQENAEQLSDRLHEVTEASNNNFAKLNEDVASIAEGKGLAPREASSTAASPSADGSASKDAVAQLRADVRDLRGRVDAIDGKVRANADAIANVDARTATCVSRLDALPASSSGSPRKAADDAPPPAAKPAPATPPPPRTDEASPKTPPGEATQPSRPTSKAAAAPPPDEKTATPDDKPASTSPPPAGDEKKKPQTPDGKAEDPAETKPADTTSDEGADATPASSPPPADAAASAEEPMEEAAKPAPDAAPEDGEKDMESSAAPDASATPPPAATPADDAAKTTDSPPPEAQQGDAAEANPPSEKKPEPTEQ